MNSRNTAKEQFNAGKQSIIENRLENCNTDKVDMAKSLFGILSQEANCNKAKAERLEEL